MKRTNNRYNQLERIITTVLASASGIFILYMFGAGNGIHWLKSFCAILSLLSSAGSFGYLYLIREWRKRRSLWMAVWAAALFICTVASLILHFPSPHPAK